MGMPFSLLLPPFSLTLPLPPFLHDKLTFPKMLLCEEHVLRSLTTQSHGLGRMIKGPGQYQSWQMPTMAAIALGIGLGLSLYPSSTP
jgi:hypothetical protein